MCPTIWVACKAHASQGLCLPVRSATYRRRLGRLGMVNVFSAEALLVGGMALLGL
jgi:hypothetical protein